MLLAPIGFLYFFLHQTIYTGFYFKKTGQLNCSGLFLLFKILNNFNFIWLKTYISW